MKCKTMPKVFTILGNRGHVLVQALEVGGIKHGYRKGMLGPRRFFSVFWETLAQLIEHIKYPFCTIIVDSVEYVPLALIISKTLSLKLIIRVRGDVWAESNQVNQTNNYNKTLVKFLIIIFERALKNAYSIVPVCEFLSRKIIENVKVDSNKIHSIPISVNYGDDHYTPTDVAKVFYGVEGKTVLLTITNFRFPDKVDRILFYLPYLAKILKDNPSFMYVVAGGGGYLETFKGKILSTYPEISSQIKFLGHIHEIEKLYSASEIVLYFTGLDALPRVILEAQSMKKIVIADNFAGISEIISHKKNGYLLNYENDLCQFIYESLKDKNIQKKIGMQSNLNIKERFSPEVVGLMWLNHINNISQSKRMN